MKKYETTEQQLIKDEKSKIKKLYKENHHHVGAA